MSKIPEDSDPFFTSLCSSKTLQSNTQGFFLNFAEHVSEEAEADWLVKVFGKLTTDEARINACYTDNKVGSAVRDTLSNVQEIFRPKSAKVSRDKRRDGDRAWTAGNPQLALVLYSQSVMRAPSKGVDVTVDDGLSLAEALGSRSEALQVLGRHELCVADIALAIKEGYPQNDRYHLYQRMAECYREMGQIPKAKLCFQLAIKLLSETQVEQKNELEKQITLLQDVKSTEYKSEDVTRVLPVLTGGSSPDLPFASARVAISRTEGAGRFAVARQPIRTGDTLVAEPAYAACLLPENFGSHCHHCFKRLVAPIGCTNCSSLAFCSLKCRDDALGSYHKYECHFMDMLIGSGMSILCHLALRMITQSGLQHFLQLRPSLTKHQESNATQDKYLSVHNLVTLSERRPPEEFLHRTLMAMFLLKCLQRTDFFPKPTPDNKKQLSKDELFIGSLLLRHLQILQFNAHEINETSLEAANQIKHSRLVNIGIAIYPTVSLFNHDCHPAVSRHFIGTSIVIRALRPLAVGEVVAENYGPSFTKQLMPLRQRSLMSRYWFKCACRACVEDWPTLDDMKSTTLRIKCPTDGCKHLFSRTLQRPKSNKKNRSTSVKCLSCAKHVSLDDVTLSLCDNDANYSEGTTNMEAGNIELAVSKFCSYLDRIQLLGSPPYRDIHVCETALRCCFSLDGNTWIKAKVEKSNEAKN